MLHSVTKPNTPEGTIAMSTYEVWHNTRCDQCDADLVETDSIEITFSCADHQFERYSSVQSNGLLLDVDDLIEHGYHAGSRCVECGCVLEELKKHSLKAQ